VEVKGEVALADKTPTKSDRSVRISELSALDPPEREALLRSFESEVGDKSIARPCWLGIRSADGCPALVRLSESAPV
jgi:hypothetical protein